MTNLPASGFKFLGTALRITFVAHLVAMVAMVTLMIPGMPGRGTPMDHWLYIQSHDWQWKLGWFTWQVTSITDLVLAWAIFRFEKSHRLASIVALGLTVLAYVVEQPAEFRWMWKVPDAASQFAAFEHEVYVQTSLWAALLYAMAAVAWSLALMPSPIWSKALTLISFPTWGVLILCSAGPLLSPRFQPEIIGPGVALGFALMSVWFFLLVWNHFQTSHMWKTADEN